MIQALHTLHVSHLTFLLLDPDGHTVVNALHKWLISIFLKTAEDMQLANWQRGSPELSLHWNWT